MNYTDRVCKALKQARVFNDSDGHNVTSIDISQDGSQVVTSSDGDEALRLYDSSTSGTLFKTLYAKKYGVSRVRFTHAPGTVVCTSRNDWDHSLRYWSLHDNRYLRYFKGHRAEVVGLSVAPKDDFLLSACAAGTCRLWDVRSDACSGFLRLPTKDARPCVSFDETGLTFAVAAAAPNRGGAIVSMFATADHDRGPFTQSSKGDYMMTTPKAALATSIKFSSDGKHMILAGGSDSCWVIDSFTAKCVSEYRLSCASSVITDAAITPDCKYVIAGTLNKASSDASGSLHIWPLISGDAGAVESGGPKVVTEEVAVHVGKHAGPVHAVLCSPVTLMVASACKNLNLWLPDPAMLQSAS